MIALLLAAVAPAALVGIYDGGQMEIAAGLELRADGNFSYGLAYGALDEEAEGVWTVEELLEQCRQAGVRPSPLLERAGVEPSNLAHWKAGKVPQVATMKKVMAAFPEEAHRVRELWAGVWTVEELLRHCGEAGIKPTPLPRLANRTFRAPPVPWITSPAIGLAAKYATSSPRSSSSIPAARALRMKTLVSTTVCTRPMSAIGVGKSMV